MVKKIFLLEGLVIGEERLLPGSAIIQIMMIIKKQAIAEDGLPDV